MTYWPIPGRLKIVSVMNDPARTPARSSPNVVVASTVQAAVVRACFGKVQGTSVLL